MNIFSASDEVNLNKNIILEIVLALSQVTPQEVMEPSIPGPSFIIVDCPARKYISGITKHEAFRKYQKDGTEQATLVVHMTKKHLVKEESYQEWMSRYFIQ